MDVSNRAPLGRAGKPVLPHWALFRRSKNDQFVPVCSIDRVWSWSGQKDGRICTEGEVSSVFFAEKKWQTSALTILRKKPLMPNDTGLLLDFGVRLPSPSPWGGAFLLACGHTRFHSKSKHPPQTLPPSRLGNLFDLNNFRRLLRFEITLSHRHSGSKITAAPATRKFIFRRPDRMSTGFTNMPILPRTETVCRIFHKTCPPISNTVSILENDRCLSIYLTRLLPWVINWIIP